MDKIINYIITKYNPHTLILYGSYADGTYNKNSDFDALIITDKHYQIHDSTIVNDVLLDVFIHHTSEFNDNMDYAEFIQIFDGNIVIDKYGIGQDLKEKVIIYMNNCSFKTFEENQMSVKWCEKMLLRAQRKDAEGFYRWHWLLMDSLEIYHDICKIRYLGPKKALLKMKYEDPTAFETYEKALSKFDYSYLEEWIQLLNIKLKESGHLSEFHRNGGDI